MGKQTADEKKKVVKITEVVKRCIACMEKVSDNNWCSHCKEFVKERDIYPAEE